MSSTTFQKTASHKGKTDFVSPFITISSMFLIWGFVTNLNGILVPHLRRAFDLSNLESQLINFTFFATYLFIAIPAGILIKRVGYKKAMTIGILLSGIGAFSFVPAAQFMKFYFFMGALVILAAGITILQVAANAYIIGLGKSRFASARLSMAGGFNSLGAMVAPTIGSLLVVDMSYLYENKTTVSKEFLVTEAAQVQEPYIILGCLMVILGLLIYMSTIPSLPSTLSRKFSFSVLKKRNVAFGVLAIFFYVGAEVALMQNIGVLSEMKGAGENYFGYSYGTVFMGLAMIGRFLGVPILTRSSPRKVLALSAVGAVMMLAAGSFTQGALSMTFFMLMGLFNSIMWPVIYDLGLRSLGNKFVDASSFLVMAIVGGAVVPLVVSYLIELKSLWNYDFVGLTVVALCYIYIWGYSTKFSVRRRKIKRPSSSI